MIDPQQLIIGAYVSLGGQIKQVHTIEPYPFGGPYRINAHYISSDLRPIPITEQWLLDLGCELDGDTIVRVAGLVFWRGKTNDGELCLVNTIGARHIHFYYVHMLQAIIYFATGELLTKKL